MSESKPQRQSRGSAVPEQEIIAYISQFMPLTDAEAKAVIANLKVRNHKKGAMLLREGQIARVCYFVLKGCVRQYYLMNGEEKTTNFFTEGQPVTSYEGTYKGKPSRFYLSCVEDCMLTQSSPEDEAAFFRQFPRLVPAGRQAMEEELGKSQTQLSNYIMLSPEERYLQLLKTRPDLLDRVPQYQLASFLGVTPESLSRIRKRIMLK